MKLFGVSAKAYFPGTTVHSGIAAAAWTDLDLSSVVGSRKALVLLKYAKDDKADTDYLWVRTKGETENVGNAGTTLVACDADQIGYIVAVTNSDGYVQQLCNDAAAVWTVTVEAYTYR